MKLLATINIPAQTVTLLDPFQQPQTHTIPAQPGAQQEIEIDEASLDAVMARYGLMVAGQAPAPSLDALPTEFTSAQLFAAGSKALQAGR